MTTLKLLQMRPLNLHVFTPDGRTYETPITVRFTADDDLPDDFDLTHSVIEVTAREPRPLRSDAQHFYDTQTGEEFSHLGDAYVHFKELFEAEMDAEIAARDEEIEAARDARDGSRRERTLVSAVGGQTFAGNAVAKFATDIHAVGTMTPPKEKKQ